MTDEQQAAALQDMTKAMQAAAWYGIALNPLVPVKDRLAAAIEALDYYENAQAPAWDEGFEAGCVWSEEIEEDPGTAVAHNPYRPEPTLKRRP